MPGAQEAFALRDHHDPSENRGHDRSLAKRLVRKGREPSRDCRPRLDAGLGEAGEPDRRVFIPLGSAVAVYCCDEERVRRVTMHGMSRRASVSAGTTAVPDSGDAMVHRRARGDCAGYSPVPPSVSIEESFTPTGSAKMTSRPISSGHSSTSSSGSGSSWTARCIGWSRPWLWRRREFPRPMQRWVRDVRIRDLQI